MRKGTKDERAIAPARRLATLDSMSRWASTLEHFKFCRSRRREEADLNRKINQTALLLRRLQFL
jgi:hypothetical protein